MKKSLAFQPGIIAFHQAKFNTCITTKLIAQTMKTRCHIHTLADAMSFERFTRSFSSNVTKSFTSSIAEFIVSLSKTLKTATAKIINSKALKLNITPRITPATISIGISRWTVPDSLNMIFRPLFESQMFWKMLRKTFFLSGFTYFKELAPFLIRIILYNYSVASRHAP